MKTEMLYLEDSYLKEITAKVIEIRDNNVILDKTIFYAASGGQPSDTGLIRGKKESHVLEVDKKEEILHKVDILPEINESVTLLLDWNRRYAHMRLHTAIHIISAIAMNEFKARITGNQIGDNNARIDFNFQEWNPDIVKGIEKRANEEISKNHTVSILYMKREEILNMEGSVKVDPKLIPDLNVLRVIKIGDIDIQPDGGTHVKNTSEIGTLTVYKTENKGKNNKRIYFTLSGLTLTNE